MAENNSNISSDINLRPNTQRMRLGAYSAPSLATIQGYILEEARRELRFPKAALLYKKMMLDPNISSAVSLIELLLSRVKWKIEVPKDAPEEEKEICKKLNYNLTILQRPFEEYIIEFLSYLVFGFCTPEKIYQDITDSPYGNFKGWSDFRVISQDTVYQWFFDNSTGELLGLRQDLSRINKDGYVLLGTGSNGASNATIDVPRKKFMLFRHNPKRNNPEGNSPLKACYTSWKYRSIIEEYETIGVTKDLGGIPVIGIAVEYLSKAVLDPTGQEAQVIADLEKQAANLHAGDQSYVIRPIAYDSLGNSLFEFDLKGVDGGGKQYDTDKIVRRHDTKILMTFFADVLKLGNDQHGSFSLADSKTNLLTMGIEAHVENILRVLNHDLIPQTYELNKWAYNAEKSCRFVHEDIEKQDIESLAKALQNVGAVGFIRPAEDIEDKLRKDWLGLPPTKEASPKFLESSLTSKSGEGKTEGLNNGTGSSTSSGASRSTSNKSK